MSVFLGYEVGTGMPVSITITHMIVTGLTQKSGKTTTLRALASRAQQNQRVPVKILFFKTKPGEKAFDGEHEVTPYFREVSDWRFVASLLEATVREKLKFERSWIINACKGTKTLRDVDNNIVKSLGRAREGSLAHSVLTNLHAYFELVLPDLEHSSFSGTFPELLNGVNVMDLTPYKDKVEVQSLVIRSCLEYILNNLTHTVSIMSELWKFCPEGRGNPVKYVLESLIKQGATQKNFCWLDSQDLASVDKRPLKNVFTWILGLQTERNEVQHTLDQIPLPKSEKPKTEDIMRLKIGHFILASPETVKKVYVQPKSMTGEMARDVALEKIPVEDLMLEDMAVVDTRISIADGICLSKEEYEAIDSRLKKLEERPVAK